MIAKIWFINRPVQIKNNSQSVYSFSSPSFMDLHILFMNGRTSISQSDDLIHPFTFWCTKINTCCHMNDGCLFKVVYSFNSAQIAFLFHHESKVSLIIDKYEWKRLCIITTSLDVWDEQRVVTVRNEGNVVIRCSWTTGGGNVRLSEQTQHEGWSTIEDSVIRFPAWRKNYALKMNMEFYFLEMIKTCLPSFSFSQSSL